MIGELFYRRIPLIGIGRKGAEHRIVYCRVEPLHAQGGDHQLSIVDCIFSFRNAVGQKRIGARNHFVSQACKGPFVATLAQIALLHLLGRHIANSAAFSSTIAGLPRQARQAKIGNLHVPLLVDQHIFGLDVEVKHLMGMGNLQRLRHRFEYGGNNVGVHFIGVRMQHLGKSHAINILQDEVRHAILHFEVVHLNDGGIRKLRCRASLFQPRHRRSVDSALLQKNAPALGEHFRSLFKGHALDGNSALNARVPRNLHRGKAAMASLPLQAIAPQQEVSLAGRLLNALRQLAVG